MPNTRNSTLHPIMSDSKKVVVVFADYSCALVGDILLQGHLYITKNYFAFYSNVFGYVTKVINNHTYTLYITLML